MFLRKLIKTTFNRGNVCVTGLRGTGKDMLFSNVVSRRKQPYVSNIDYGGEFYQLDFNKIDCGKNTYKNLIDNDIKYYEYPYPLGSDIYISDVGIYLPSHYCNELNKLYPYLPTYQALSRQVSHNNVHINVQNLNRCWDKIREQSDIYIRCRRCIYIFGLVIQLITIYDKYQSCVDRVKPCRINVPLFATKEVKQNARMYLEKFYNSYGSVSNRILFYVNKSKYDTYYFEKLFKGGKKNEK